MESVDDRDLSVYKHINIIRNNSQHTNYIKDMNMYLFIPFNFFSVHVIVYVNYEF